MKTSNGHQTESNKLFEVIATRRSSGENLVTSTFLPNPDEVLSKLNKGLEAYEGMLYDPHIWACIQSRKAGVLSLLWDVDKGVDRTVYADFVTDFLKNLDVRKIIGEMLDATAYGFQPLEVTWRRIDHKIVPTAIIGKPPHWFSFDENLCLRFLRKGTKAGEIVPSKKVLIVQNNSTYLNPYGVGFLSKCFWSWTFKKGGIKFWVRFVEKYGMPWAYGKIARNADQSEIDDLFAMIDELVQDGVGVLPEDSEIGVLDATKSSSPAVYQGLLDFCNTEISKAILSQTLTTQQGDTGSYAMSKTHFEVRQDVVDSDIRLVEEAFNTLIRWVIDLNFLEVSDYPKFQLYRSTDVDKTLAERDSLLWSSGYVKPTQSYIDRAYGFEQGDVEVIDKPMAESIPFAEEDEAVAELKSSSEKSFSDAYRKMLFSVAKIIEKAANYEELEVELGKVFPLLSVDEMADIIKDATLLGRAKGELETLASTGAKR